MSFAPETHPRAASLDLWRHFRAFLCSVLGIFGQPEDLAARHTLTMEEWRHTNTWLTAAEALLRRLLLIEAAAISAPPVRPRAKARRPRAHKLIAFHPDKPEAWRVHFRCFLDRRRPRRHTATRSSVAPSRFASAWPLALRLEALLRVFNNPHAYAARLAARLRRPKALHHDAKARPFRRSRRARGLRPSRHRRRARLRYELNFFQTPALQSRRLKPKGGGACARQIPCFSRSTCSFSHNCRARFKRSAARICLICTSVVSSNVFTST